VKKIEIYVSGNSNESMTSAVYDAMDMIGRGVKSAEIVGPDFKIGFGVYELIELLTDDVVDA
jgi:hypothetical protein